MWLGEFEALGVALGGKAVYVRAAGVGKSHYFGAFVEGFACGVVDSLPEHFHVAVASHEYKLRVASRHEHAEKWEFGHFVVGLAAHEMAEHVPVQVVHIHHGHTQTQRQAFCETCAHKQ